MLEILILVIAFFVTGVVLNIWSSRLGWRTALDSLLVTAFWPFLALLAIWVDHAKKFSDWRWQQTLRDAPYLEGLRETRYKWRHRRYHPTGYQCGWCKYSGGYGNNLAAA